MMDTLRPAKGLPALLGEGGGLLPLLPVFLWWAVWRGGQPPAVWLASLVFLCVAALLLVLARAPRMPRGPLLVALLAGLALVAWSGLSLLWAQGDRQAALLATLRLALFWLVLALPALWPPSAAALRAGLVVFVAAVAAGGVSALAAGGVPLVDGRLVAPTDYVNATAVLFGSGALVAVALAARAGTGWLWRAVFVGAAAPLLGLSLLAESRGATAALAVTVIIALVLSPWRTRFAAHGLAAVVVLAIGAPSLLHVRTAALAAAHPSLGGQGTLLALLALGFGAGALCAFAEPRMPHIPRMWTAIAVLAALAGAVLAVAALPRAIDSLTHPDYTQLDRSSTRFSGDLGSFRPSYWAAALKIGARHPALGVGSGGFAEAYLAVRTNQVAPLHAHDAWLEAFAELGVPGLLLLLAVSVALALALWPGRRRALLGAAALPSLYLALHALFDWATVFPAITGPALAFAASAAMLARPASVPLPRWPAVLLVGLATVAGVQLVAARLVERAYAEWPTDPAAAFADLHHAARLAPLDASPALGEGVIDIELGRSAQDAFHRAIARDHRNWFPYYALGLLAAARGERGRALEMYARAAALDHDEHALQRAYAALNGGYTLDPRTEILRTLAEN
jgi:hypothetical protein